MGVERRGKLLPKKIKRDILKAGTVTSREKNIYGLGYANCQLDRSSPLSEGLKD